MIDRTFLDRVEVRYDEPGEGDHPERGPWSVWVQVDGGYPSPHEAQKQAAWAWVEALEQAGGDAYLIVWPRHQALLDERGER